MEQTRIKEIINDGVKFFITCFLVGAGILVFWTIGFHILEHSLLYFVIYVITAFSILISITIVVGRYEENYYN